MKKKKLTRIVCELIPLLKEFPSSLTENEDFFLEVITEDRTILKHASWYLLSDRSFIEKAMSIDALCLAYASDELKDDYGLVVNHIEGFKCASERLRKKRELALKAIVNNPLNLYYVSKELQDDKEIVELAVSAYGGSLCWASERLTDDYGIVLTAVRNTGKALYWASERLKDDETLVLEAIRQDPCYLFSASDRIKAMPTIVAIK